MVMGTLIGSNGHFHNVHDEESLGLGFSDLLKCSGSRRLGKGGGEGTVAEWEREKWEQQAGGIAEEDVVRGYVELAQEARGAGKAAYHYLLCPTLPAFSRGDERPHFLQLEGPRRARVPQIGETC